MLHQVVVSVNDYLFIYLFIDYAECEAHGYKYTMNI